MTLKERVVEFMTGYPARYKDGQLAAYLRALEPYPDSAVQAALDRAARKHTQQVPPPIGAVLNLIPMAAPAPVEVRPVDYSVNLIRHCVHDSTPDSVWLDMTAEEREKHAKAVVRTATGSGRPEDLERRAVFLASPDVRAWFAKLGCSHLLPRPVQHTLEGPADVPDPFADEVAV